jgi:aspartyl-tRNA synthetase
LYGNFGLVQSKEKLDRKFHDVSELTGALADQKVWVRARLHTSRSKGKQCFFTLRQKIYTIQGLISVNENISKKMVKFVAE